jgi:hypothetical protein
VRRYLPRDRIVSGPVMITIGLLIFFSRFTIIAQWLAPYLPTF